MFNKNKEKGKTYISRNTCIELFRESVEMTVDQINQCFGMSKMIVKEDYNVDLYDRIEFPEFLEMICRVADMKFRGTELLNE